jgi:hypothetical protein
VDQGCAGGAGGLSHRRRAVAEGRESEVSRTAGWISPVLVVDGRVAGVWERSADGPITVRTFGRLPAAVRRAVAQRADAELVWT